ncbi:MAG: hypothetical protein M1462_05365 [Candidatus Thermoplasmatota archaeon]|jgi:NADH:ubiquinone oxidoreductase subunit 6 (subunit J)|uniref:hypothetical protein n=1 Tax=Ferroplasma sp. Type II TaxID=261388 RepID=UPI0017E88ECB|nr:hypothetical protein [Ferroplasma sp. Type II]MCL4311838.1 hypothetical protein [Candidatus Thermoplasmatota archaeon]HIH60121.1 hypothetical protein [Ferroplasma sp.]HII83205.1 hypothetical protein [Ferroplasma sp.]
MLIGVLTIYGSVVLAIMMVFYLLESRSPVYSLLFGIMCFGSAIYGILAGVYPFGVIESIWGIFSVHRFIKRIRVPEKQ